MSVLDSNPDIKLFRTDLIISTRELIDFLVLMELDLSHPYDIGERDNKALVNEYVEAQQKYSCNQCISFLNRMAGVVYLKAEDDGSLAMHSLLWEPQSRFDFSPKQMAKIHELRTRVVRKTNVKSAIGWNGTAIGTPGDEDHLHCRSFEAFSKVPKLLPSVINYRIRKLGLSNTRTCDLPILIKSDGESVSEWLFSSSNTDSAVPVKKLNLNSSNQNVGPALKQYAAGPTHTEKASVIFSWPQHVANRKEVLDLISLKYEPIPEETTVTVCPGISTEEFVTQLETFIGLSVYLEPKDESVCFTAIQDCQTVPSVLASGEYHNLFSLSGLDNKTIGAAGWNKVMGIGLRGIPESAAAVLHLDEVARDLQTYIPNPLLLKDIRPDYRRFQKSILQFNESHLTPMNSTCTMSLALQKQAIDAEPFIVRVIPRTNPDRVLQYTVS